MPRFQGSVGSLIGAADRAEKSRPELAEKQMTAVDEATARYEAEVAAS
jgi:limonene 1,2-monooxygenase